MIGFNLVACDGVRQYRAGMWFGKTAADAIKAATDHYQASPTMQAILPIDDFTFEAEGLDESI